MVRPVQSNRSSVQWPIALIFRFVIYCRELETVSWMFASYRLSGLRKLAYANASNSYFVFQNTQETRKSKHLIVISIKIHSRCNNIWNF